jgi:hypothetical protein
LKCYVEQGGVIVLSLAQLSERVDRKLFHDWERANVYNDGDVSDLFGVRIGKPSEEFSGSVECVNFPSKDYTEAQDLIRLPYNDENEDGDCRLAEITIDGAEVCLIDEKNHRPLLVRKKVGKGYAYLLCAYAYPGHEKLKYVCANVMQTMLDIYLKKDVYVIDKTKQAYWSDWKNGDSGKLYILNIDWTKKGNKKPVEVVKDHFSFDLEIEEGNLLEIAYQKQSAVYTTNKQVNVVAKADEENAYEIYGFGECDLHIISPRETSIIVGEKQTQKITKKETVISLELNGKETLRLKIN